MNWTMKIMHLILGNLSRVEKNQSLGEHKNDIWIKKFGKMIKIWQAQLDLYLNSLYTLDKTSQDESEAWQYIEEEDFEDAVHVLLQTFPTQH